MTPLELAKRIVEADENIKTLQRADEIINEHYGKLPTASTILELLKKGVQHERRMRAYLVTHFVIHHS